MNPIRWFDVVLPDYPSALEYIEKHDQNRYDCIAVKYKQATNPSKKTLELQEKEVACHREHRNADLLVPAMGFKSDYFGCKKCGSKINRKYIRTNGCPVCGEDMRSLRTYRKLPD